MQRSRRRTSSCGMNYWSFFEVQECELNTQKKKLIWQLHVWLNWVLGAIWASCLWYCPASHLFCFAEHHGPGLLYIVHHRSGWYHWKEKEMKRMDFRAIKIGEKCAMCECTNRPASLFYKNAKESNRCHGLAHIFQFWGACFYPLRELQMNQKKNRNQ